MPDINDIKQLLQAGRGDLSLSSLLEALLPTLTGEAQEVTRAYLAMQKAKRLNRGVTICDPEIIDDIDPLNYGNVELMHKHVGALFAYAAGGATFGGFSADKSKFVIVSQDLVIARRREILEIIINDYLGNRPAVELAGPDPAPGLFLFSGTKLYPHELSEKNLKLFVDYFEQAETDEWYYPYWQLARSSASQVAHWLPRDEEP